MIPVSLLNPKFAMVLLNNRANFGFGTPELPAGCN